MLPCRWPISVHRAAASFLGALCSSFFSGPQKLKWRKTNEYIPKKLYIYDIILILEMRSYWIGGWFSPGPWASAVMMSISITPAPPPPDPVADEWMNPGHVLGMNRIASHPPKHYHLCLMLCFLWSTFNFWNPWGIPTKPLLVYKQTLRCLLMYLLLVNWRYSVGAKVCARRPPVRARAPHVVRSTLVVLMGGSLPPP